MLHHWVIDFFILSSFLILILFSFGLFLVKPLQSPWFPISHSALPCFLPSSLLFTFLSFACNSLEELNPRPWAKSVPSPELHFYSKIITLIKTFTLSFVSHLGYKSHSLSRTAITAFIYWQRCSKNLFQMNGNPTGKWKYQ